MPRWRDGRPLKRWRYVGAYGPEVMWCVGDAHIGPLRQRFWAVATPDGRLWEKTALLGAAGLTMTGADIAIESKAVRLQARVTETAGVETLSKHGESYIWTRKQGGVEIEGKVELEGKQIEFKERGVVDESAGYHARRTVWSWSAGVGTLSDGTACPWNLVTGVHDADTSSERTLWIEGQPTELAPVTFNEDVSKIEGPDVDLSIHAWAERRDNTNAVLLKTTYRQPFGTFTGHLAGNELAAGFGVTEAHDVHW